MNLGWEPCGAGGSHERSGPGFQNPLPRAACRGSRVVNPLLRGLKTRCLSVHTRLPPSSALLPKVLSPPPLHTHTPQPWNGEAGRGKPLKPETSGWGWGEWIFPELVGLWPRARAAEKFMSSCHSEAPRNPTPRTWGQRQVGG